MSLYCVPSTTVSLCCDLPLSLHCIRPLHPPLPLHPTTASFLSLHPPYHYIPSLHPSIVPLHCFSTLSHHCLLYHCILPLHPSTVPLLQPSTVSLPYHCSPPLHPATVSPPLTVSFHCVPPLMHSTAIIFLLFQMWLKKSLERSWTWLCTQESWKMCLWTDFHLSTGYLEGVRILKCAFKSFDALGVFFSN